MNRVAEVIKEKRFELRLSKAEMARRIGISSQLYNNYEEGVHNPKTDFYIKWKNLFNQDLLLINIDDAHTNFKVSEPNEPYGLAHDHNYLIGIIKTQAEAILKQQETIHYLTTGHTQGGKNVTRKNA